MDRAVSPLEGGPPDRPAVRGLRGRRHPGARRTAPSRAPRPPDERARPGPARPRLPAARARDRRPVVLRQVRRRAAPGARARPERPRRDSGLGSLALSRHRFRAGARSSGRRALALSPTTARNYGVIGDALARARPLPTGVRRLRHDEAAQAEPLLVRARLLRPRAARPARRRPIKAMKLARRRRHRRARAARLDARPARQALLKHGTARRRRARVPRCARDLPRLRRTGSTRSRRSSSPAGTCGGDRRSSGARSRPIPLPQYVGLLGDLYQATGHARAARGQYALSGRSSRLLPRTASARIWRPRSSTSTTASACAPRSRSRARRSASGRRSTATTCSPGRSPATAAAREALHYSKLALRLGTQDSAQVLPSRRDRACLGHDPRPWAPSAISSEPALLPALDARRCGGSHHETPRSCSRQPATLLVPAGVASAHPLGNFTINRYAGSSSPATASTSATWSTWRRSRPSSACRSGIGALHVSVDGRRRSRCASRRPRSPTRKAPPACGRRASRRCSPGPGSTAAATVSVDDRNYSGRIGWKEIVLGANDPLRVRRVARVPEEPAPQPAARDAGAGAAGPERRRPADAPHRPRARGAGPDRRLELRLADRPAAPERARRADLAGARDLLGRRARAVARPRQDDRLRLSRRLPRHSAGTPPCSV